ncbi:MAG: asparagine--tRNA ligase [Bacteroidetes bacterium]|nr:MAG: asparagine--tRNA ligase [Bacteroidota bacterium]TAG89810.1 MAG: asparagine--tRNA ligase [Bacteroidota bacterium]
MKQRIINILKNPIYDQKIIVKGWVKTKRGSKNVNFIALNDGSTIQNLQIVADAEKISEDILKLVQTGACIAINGTLIASQGAGQAMEVVADSIEILGEANPDEYKIQAKAHTLEFLREQAHLRSRTSTFGAIFRIRHALAFAVHQYFNEKGFFYWHSPIITGSDAEGAGQMFRVTTLPDQNPPLEDGKVNYKEDFFGQPTNLTVSGQLEAELGAMGLGLVYTFGPTFRAENSNTARHLAEFWMIEPEMAFYDLQDNMDLVEDFLKYLINYALTNCGDDLAFLEKRLLDEEKTKKKEEQSEMSLLEKLKFVVAQDFQRLTYTEAIEVLLGSNHHKKKKFQYEVKWGIDLQSEHERYLVEKHFKKPVILTDYPKDIKAFYMKQNEDGKTVRAMDVLFPCIGEMVGGSQREENYDKLLERMRQMGVHEQGLWWYLETRKFGTAPHAGFGLGFERLVLFVTGMSNIRDVIPFPRTPQNADF